jgi:hypothetical protein
MPDYRIMMANTDQNEESLGILSYHTVSIVIVINGSILNLMDIQNG